MTCGMEYGDAIDKVDKSAPVLPTNTKELALWKNKDKKAYALIIASISEEVDIKFLAKVIGKH